MSKPAWERPRTNKIYLHPPFAERLQILWPDFKVTNSDIADDHRHIREHGSGWRFSQIISATPRCLCASPRRT